MKTPREILLARHRAVEPRLDAIREAVVGRLDAQPAKPQPKAISFLSPSLYSSRWSQLANVVRAFAKSVSPSAIFHHLSSLVAASAALWLRTPNTLWRELILPSRRIWTGLAAVWLLLFILNVAQRDPAGAGAGQPRRSPAVMLSWQVQQRWMDELLADRSAPPEADRPRTMPPRPRTEETEVMAA